MSDARRASLSRKTAETAIELELAIDGAGARDITTPLPFFTHMLEAFAKHGLYDLVVRASGDIAVGDPPPGKTGWRIGIAPLDPDQPPMRFVRLANQAISTSGDSRQHLVVDGRRYSHIIDPRTGQGVAGRSSVTVIAKTGLEADALATAVSVLGAEQGLALTRQRNNVELLVVAEDAHGQQREVRSPGFSKLHDATPPAHVH